MAYSVCDETSGKKVGLSTLTRVAVPSRWLPAYLPIRTWASSHVSISLAFIERESRKPKRGKGDDQERKR